MKTIIRCFATAILYACVVTQEILPCYSNESRSCTRQRFRCCALSGLEFGCCFMAKQLFITTSDSLSKNCLTLWCPYTTPCNNTTDTIGVTYEWATTGCILLSAIKCAVGFFPCVTEDHYKKIRENFCCCFPDECFLCPDQPAVILNGDARRN